MTPENWSARTPLILGLLTLTVLVGGFGFWSSQATIAGAIIASGRIEVEQNRQVVQHLDGGIVAELLIQEGTRVEEGQTLVRLEGRQARSEFIIIEGQLYETLARRGRLEAERDSLEKIEFSPMLLKAAETNEDVAKVAAGQSRLFEARNLTVAREAEQLGKRGSQINDQIGGIDAQSVALSMQLTLIEQELVGQQELLDKGLAQISRVLALQREQANLSGRVGELAAQRAQAEGRVTEIELEILKLQSTRREAAISELRDVQFNELELLERRRALGQRLSRLEIKAPVSGVIYGLAIFGKQSIIRPAEPVLYIVPQDRPLVITSQIEAIHVDQIYVEQDVTLRFSAFDQRTTPELSGRVIQISADAFFNETTGASFYRAEILLNDGEISRLPDGIKLIPGMPVESFIKTTDRSPIAYLVKPLADYFTKAFREG